ncbi:MAG: hypothetical protein LUD24_04000 [Phascolarctobacterium sp.]|nr:hypothetical protein [Phascolarctobacterium sp.]
MKKIDMRFDEKIFKGMINATFEKYRADYFKFKPSVTQIVGLYIGGKVYSITNIQEPIDYFGDWDDYAVCKFSHAKDSDIVSAFVDVEQIDTPVMEPIKSILLVNENQQLIKNDILTYDVWLTRAIIFNLGERQISFEKESVPFSEEIVIRRGYDLIDMVSTAANYFEDWNPLSTPHCTLKVI